MMCNFDHRILRDAWSSSKNIRLLLLKAVPLRLVLVLIAQSSTRFQTRRMATVLSSHSCCLFSTSVVPIIIFFGIVSVTIIGPRLFT